MVNVAMKIGMNRHEYDQKNHLVETKKNGQIENRYLYDGDGNRVARLDKNNEGTIFIGNYFEARYPAEEELISPFFDCASEGSYCTYLPIVGNTEVNELFTGRPGVSYYYSGNQRIAMRTGSEAYLLFGDHLGSSSLLVKADGTIAEKAYYLPWGGTRGEEAITSTDYGYTGQMREGDIYYYGARWYDPTIGRFMQADTIVPLNVQGTQAFDRYAYVNNNPLRYTDPSGHRMCDDFYSSNCSVSNISGINYRELIAYTFGVTLNKKTAFNKEQQKTVYNALSKMAESATTNWGLPGSQWVKSTFGGTMISQGGFVSGMLSSITGTQFAFTLPNNIVLPLGFGSQWQSTIIHEFGHILDNRRDNGGGTYFGMSDSWVLSSQSGAVQIPPVFPFKFIHFGDAYSPMYFPKEYQTNRYIYPNEYGNLTFADYYAEGFKMMLVDPANEGIPMPVRNFFETLFWSMK